MPEKINFCIVGCGRIAQRHAEHISIRGKLIAVCDIIKERADELAARYSARPYYSIDELLQSEATANAMAVCTPNGLHAGHTTQALKAGLHVVCEKPMSLSVSDCDKMIKTADSVGKNLFVIKQNRYNPPVRALKKLLDENRLGKVYSVQLTCFWNRNSDYYKNSWHGTVDLDGGTLYTQFSHFIDLLYWMMGDIITVKAMRANFAHKGEIEFEDSGVVIVEFQNGAIGTINYTVNSYKENMEGSLTVIAEKGTVKIGGQYLNELEYQHIEGTPVGKLAQGNKANRYGSYEGSMSNHDKVYDHVFTVLENGGEMCNSAMDGLKTVEIIEKIYKAAAFIQ